MGTPKSRAIRTLAEKKVTGPSFTTSGAIPGASQEGWKGAYPHADATMPDTLPEAIAATMETDPDVEARPAVKKTSRGPVLSMAGAMPGGSESDATSAYPSADATKPETMPSSIASRATSGPATKEQLYSQARRKGISGRSSMNKAQLRRALSL